MKINQWSPSALWDASGFEIIKSVFRLNKQAYVFFFKLNDSIVNVGLPQNHSQNRLEHMAKLASGSY